MIVFCSYRYMSFIIKAMEESNLEVKDVLVWKRGHELSELDNKFIEKLKHEIEVLKNQKYD